MIVVLILASLIVQIGLLSVAKEVTEDVSNIEVVDAEILEFPEL
jgi:hypothetical protein